jgi:hypothetical protein
VILFITLSALTIFCDLFSLEDTIKALKEKEKEPLAPELEPEPTTEVLFLCSYEGCGKTFIDAGALRKHSHIHGERQFVCHYEGCGKVTNLLLHALSSAHICMLSCMVVTY